MGSQKLLPISDFCLEVNYKFFLYLLDETGSDINWGKYNKDLNTNNIDTFVSSDMFMIPLLLHENFPSYCVSLPIFKSGT